MYFSLHIEIMSSLVNHYLTPTNYSIILPKMNREYDQTSLPNPGIVKALVDFFSHDVHKDLSMSNHLYENDTSNNNLSFDEDFFPIQVNKGHKLPAKRCLLPQLESENLKDKSQHLSKLGEMDVFFNVSHFTFGNWP